MDQYTYIHTGDFNLTTMAALTMERSSHVDTLLSRWQLMLLLFLLGSCSAQSTYYVTPTPNTPCPRESCHTLSEYVVGQFFSNLPVNTTMEFLPGNHTLEQTISVTNVTWLTLHGDSSSLPEVTSRIECTWPAGFVFTNITELYISAMAFISCGHHNRAAILIISIQHSNISYCSFHNSVNVDSFGGALYIHNSYVILTVNKFQHNTADVGGALTVQYGTLNVTENEFQNNSADSAGGAVCVLQSALNFTENTFQNNSADSDGGAVCVLQSTLNFTENTFQNNSANYGGVVYVQYGTLNLAGNTFQSNTADSDGGAVYVLNSTLNLTENTFQNNSANYGGAVYVEYGTLNLTENTFQNNSVDSAGGAVCVVYSTLNLTENTFQSNTANYGGTVYVEYGTLNLTENTFQSNYAVRGGAVYVLNSTLNLTENTFQNNSADFNGGAVYVQYGTLYLTGNTFQYSSADYNGGVFHILYSTLNLTGNIFQNNSAGLDGGVFYILWYSTLNLIGNIFQNNSAEFDGGAFYIEHSTLNLTGNTFQYSSADYNGGVHSLWNSTLNLTGNTFEYSSAHIDGGVFYTLYSTLNVTENIFQNNSAEYDGGALSVTSSILHFVGNTFQKSYAAFGGSLHVHASNVTLTNDCFTDSYADMGGAILVIDNSLVKMYNITIGNNRAEYGGGMTAVDSQLEVLENTFFKNNRASYGGGLYVHNTEFNGNAVITKNLVTEGGGGIYASRSTFHLTDNTTIISNNSAMDGGGMLLSDNSKLLFQPSTAVYLISNSAKNTGGAINVEESNPLTYCITTERNFDASNSNCFFQIQQKMITLLSIYQFKRLIDILNASMYFDNNSAVEAGNDLYGGSVDNCTLSNFKFSRLYFGSTAISGYLFDVISENKTIISSNPLHICTCRDGLTNCTGSYHQEPVYPGGTLEVPVIALGQRNGTTTAVIQVVDVSKSISVSNLEGTQNVDNSCNTLKYTIHSHAINTTQQFTLYAQGPCSPSQTNTLTVTVNIQNCPPGFQLSTSEPICICADRLQRFTNTCLVDSTTVLREHNAEFWVGYDSDSESRGLILHPNCPFDYCTSEETYLAVDDSDKQCNYNRSGLLCGRCSENLSIALGSSHCLQCSNSYLALLAAFTFAGIALVLLLLVLRLTVAAGTINGLIFYANIVGANSAIFFQPQLEIINVPTELIANVLSVFIAWLNMDLGIETCFYNGMDAYVKTWMQFAFPLYVWALVGMIIVGSYYSGMVARMFGSNPIAVLATLFLLSYAKLLRTVIAALSYTSLEYPNSSQIAVWLYDGNVRYLSGKHIPLFTAAMVCLIFLFLPYTMLLIFSQCLQAKSQWKIFSCINGRYVKPFLDAYHAPYTNKHRYWTGLTLLLRFILFLISAVNALGDPSVNLLAIGSTCVAILTLPTVFSTRIYKKWSLGLLEISFIVNLTILIMATLYVRLSGSNQNAVTFTSVGIAFATFTGIVIYHSVQQIKGTRLWKRVCLQHNSIRVPLIDMDSGPEDPPDYVLMPRSAPTQTVVDMRELREPCMATD